MSEYEPIETVKHSSVVREDDDSELSAIRIDEGKFKGLIYLYEDVMMVTAIQMIVMLMLIMMVPMSQ